MTLEPEGIASGAFGPLRMPQGPYSDGGGEADSPQHCDTCRMFLENPLTIECEHYVKDAIVTFDRDASGDAGTINEWREFYADILAA